MRHDKLDDLHKFYFETTLIGSPYMCVYVCVHACVYLCVCVCECGTLLLVLCVDREPLCVYM